MLILDWMSLIVGKVSPWIQLHSPCTITRNNSKKVALLHYKPYKYCEVKGIINFAIVIIWSVWTMDLWFMIMLVT